MKKLIFVALYFVSSYSFLNGMDESVKQKIEGLQQNNVVLESEHRKQCYACQWSYSQFQLRNCHCPQGSAFSTKLRHEINQTILDAGNLVSDQEKLNNLHGDYMYSTRKNIIKNMIQEGINPNEIKYQYGTTPLYEAALFKDIEFGKFLIQYGAKPDKKTIEIAKPEFLVAIEKK